MNFNEEQDLKTAFFLSHLCSVGWRPVVDTSWKINIELENDALELMIFPFPGVYSQVNHVNLLGYIFSYD